LKYENGDIEIAPKIIFWIEIPEVIGEHEKIELLKRDILVIEQSGDIDVLYNLKKSKSKYTAYFYNLEGIFVKNKIKPEDYYVFSTNLATFIQGFVPERSLVHSSVIDPKISKMFVTQSINYFEKNLSDKKNAFLTAISMIKPFFSEKDKIERSSLRLNLLPLKYKVEITNLEKPDMPTIYGYLKDISLTGMAFVLHINNDLNFFKLKDKIQIKLFMQQQILKINICFITRVDEKKLEIGVIYNITDGHMIREDYANKLTSLIYNWVKGLIEKYGKIETGNAEELLQK
jgi:hypothetical protein